VADVQHEQRSGRAASATQRPAFVLSPRAPYRLDLTAWALRRRSRNRIDRWGGTYRRALIVDGRPVSVEVEQRGEDQPELAVSVLTAGHYTAEDMDSIERQVRRLLGIDVDLQAFYDLADTDFRLADLKDRFLGVRPPRFPTLFESMVNAIANQQLSLSRSASSCSTGSPIDSALVPLMRRASSRFPMQSRSWRSTLASSVSWDSACARPSTS